MSFHKINLNPKNLLIWKWNENIDKEDGFKWMMHLILNRRGKESLDRLLSLINMIHYCFPSYSWSLLIDWLFFGYSPSYERWTNNVEWFRHFGRFCRWRTDRQNECDVAAPWIINKKSLFSIFVLKGKISIKKVWNFQILISVIYFEAML
jgi:hypothetical protein